MKEIKIWSKAFIILGVLSIIANILIGLDSIISSLHLEYVLIRAMKFTFKSFALITILISYTMNRVYKVFEYQQSKINSGERRIKNLEDKIDKLMRM